MLLLPVSWMWERLAVWRCVHVGAAGLFNGRLSPPSCLQVLPGSRSVAAVWHLVGLRSWWTTSWGGFWSSSLEAARDESSQNPLKYSTLPKLLQTGWVSKSLLNKRQRHETHSGCIHSQFWEGYAEVLWGEDEPQVQRDDYVDFLLLELLLRGIWATVWTFEFCFMKMPVLIVHNIIPPVMDARWVSLLSRNNSLCDFWGFASAAVPVLLFPAVTTRVLFFKIMQRRDS